MSYSPVIKNRKAGHQYELQQEFVAGIQLNGAEVKSLRLAKASIGEAYCYFQKGELWIKGMHIAEFKNAGYLEQEPYRNRKLLLNKHELKKLHARVKEKGQVIVPLKLFFGKSGYAKLKIALGKGKKTHDKREDLKKKDQQREIERYS